MGEVVTPLPAPGGPQFRPPEAISGAHDLNAFSCAHEELNVWLKKRALANEGTVSRTYVVAQGARVVGYYTLAVGGVARGILPKLLRRNTPEQIPVVVLGRLATDKNYEGRGIGSGMLQEGIKRTLAAAKEFGVRALLFHAIDERAVGFYLKYRFMPSLIGERTLLLPVETARRALLEPFRKVVESRESDV
jgi:GNAT superfamily N-acetyltransferase